MDETKLEEHISLLHVREPQDLSTIQTLEGQDRIVVKDTINTNDNQMAIAEDNIIKLRREKVELERKYEEIVKENKELNKTIEKMKREKVKSEKDFETKITDLKNEVSDSYKEVKRYCEENTILLEEKKVLMGIHQVNTELHEKLKKKEIQNGVIEVEDETEIVEDEDTVKFKLKQRANEEQEVKSVPTQKLESGVDPKSILCAFFKQNLCKKGDNCKFSHVSKLSTKGHTGHNNKCSLCNENFNTVGLLRKHMRGTHNTVLKQRDGVPCTKSNFEATSPAKNKEHNEGQHPKQNIECIFWKKGQCSRGTSCRFLHKISQRTHSKNIRCKYQNECKFLPRCKFVHEDVKPCFYQEKCRNSKCAFYHFSSKQDNFLGFQSLRTLKTNPHQTPKPPVWMWRPW